MGQEGGEGGIGRRQKISRFSVREKRLTQSKFDSVSAKVPQRDTW